MMHPSFDGKRSLELIHRLCQFGPRPTGSVRSAQMRQWLLGEFQQLQVPVRQESFPITANSRPDQSVSAVNLIASFRPEREDRLLLGTHYDTRPIADEDPDPARRSEPILGANDGGSGVAVLLELARVLVESKTNLGIDLVFFDAEEFVFDPDEDELILGSTFFANQYVARLHRFHYVAAIVVDIVARAEMELTPDIDACTRAPDLVEEFWDLTKASPYFSRIPRFEILDDHIPLLAVGIPALVLIDALDPRWHTHEDRPEFCSAASLQAIGDLLVRWLELRLNPSRT